MLTAVVSVDPMANSHNADVSTNISATFDQPINAATASAETFVVRSPWRAGTVTVNTSRETITADPASNFFPDEIVQVTATSGIQSTSADPNVARVWQFRTAVSSGSAIFADSGQNVGASAARDVDFGDIDGDGDLDALESSEVDLVILRNDGTGVFTDTGQVINGNFYEIETGDLDGDGDLDVAASTDVFLNDGNGNFSGTGQTLLGAGGNHTATNLGDLDGDGDLDLVKGARYGGGQVWINNGSGVFTSGQALGTGTPEAFKLGDLDADGDLDVFVANYGADNRVWFNDGSGLLTDSGQALGGFAAGKDVDLGDIDGDGDLDAIVVNDLSGSARSRVWLNDGAGAFTDSGQVLAPTRAIWSVELGDFDGDGDLDAFGGAVRTSQSSLIWLNDGTGAFSDSGQNFGPTTETIHIDVGDVDGDGDLDIWEANNSQISRVFINQNLNPNVTLDVSSAEIAEAEGMATVTATMSAAHTAPVTVDLGFSGTATDITDYTASGSQIVIPVGQTTGEITITAVQDTLDDDDETVLVDITNVENADESGTQQVTITIIDDDEPVVVPDVTLAVDSANIPEDGGVATFTATLSAVTTVPVTVELGIAGTATAGDFSVSGTEIVVAPGATTGSITVTSVDDAEDEPNETVVVGKSPT